MENHRKPEDIEGRIEKSGMGVGPVSGEMLEQRAREIAIINRGKEAQVTDEDRAAAGRELSDEGFTLSSQDIRSNMASESASGDMAVETGHEVEGIRPFDEQAMEENEVKEGIREADHDRMLRSRDQEPE